ncbi:MAG: DNA N-6-adenine-methyltransferase [Chloroflexota bacterium]|nr:hypothetical protein [Chloroflexota bacterium]
MPPSQQMRLLTSSETNEWYTPPAYTDAAREAMGSIELDPASNPVAQLWIKADRCFTAADNGLEQNWAAKTLYCNPPYGLINGRSGAGLFSAKLINEYEAGNIGQAILLVFATPGYSWFNDLMGYPMCFCRQRISFIPASSSPVTVSGAAKKGSVFVYFGSNTGRFKWAFSQFGPIAHFDVQR